MDALADSQLELPQPQELGLGGGGSFEITQLQVEGKAAYGRSR